MSYWEVLSSSVGTLILGVVVCVLIYLYFRENLPGPWGLPYVGYYPFLRADFHQQLAEMARNRYGDVFFFRVFGQLFAHLASFDVIREAHVRKIEFFHDRSPNLILSEAIFKDGVISENGESWKVQRKFLVNAMRDLCSREILLPYIEDAVQGILSDLRKFNGKPFLLVTFFTEHATNIANRICFGNASRKLLDELSEAYYILLSPMVNARVLLCGPIAKYLFLPWFSTYRQLFSERKRMERLLYEFIAEREAAIKSGQIDDGLVDRFIQEKTARQEKGDPQAKFYTYKSLVGTLIQIYGDLTVGMGSFISSMLNDLAPRTDVVERMRKEIVSEFGSKAGHYPTPDDKLRLPYVNAVFKELLRCSHLISAMPSYVCSFSTGIGGVRIPKECILIINNWAAHHDPRVYDRPDEFRPERYLSTENDKVEPGPIMFGVGKRYCTGEPLIMMLQFCFVTPILKHFHLKSEPSKKAQAWDEAFIAELAFVPIKDNTEENEKTAENDVTVTG